MKHVVIAAAYEKINYGTEVSPWKDEPLRGG